jgi:protoporphyrinogen/coproporphyrinogen III oxidase
LPDVSSSFRDETTAPRIAVIGGGISGLAAAHRLTELLPHVRLALYEASGRLGGVLETVRRDGYLIERSADSFITKYPWATDRCERIGIADELVPTDETRRRASVVHAGKLIRVPAGFVLMTPHRRWPILTTPILSWRGKLRVLAEPWMPRRPEAEVGDESVGAFATRRLGREAYERLVQPLLGGIHTSDADKLSLAATFPEYIAQEQYYGRLQRGGPGLASKADDSGARYGMFVAPKNGVERIVEALAAKLPSDGVRLNMSITSLERIDSNRWRVSPANGEPETYDAVVVALPAPAAAKLVARCDAALSAELAAIEYSSCAVVCLTYRRDQFAEQPDGFGFVVPRIERRQIIAASFASEKFAGRAPDNEVLIRVFIGGALAPQLAELPEPDLVRIAQAELGELMRISGEPLWTDVARWNASMPQYRVGHLQRVARIESRVTELAGLALAGNAYRGVGIPQCIHSGELAAEAVAAQLASRPLR